MDISVVLISADIEWLETCYIFKPERLEESPYGAWFYGKVPGFAENRSIIYFHGGWGKIAAAASVQYAIDRWHPDVLVNIGTCGGIEGLIEKGQIVLVDKTVVYDVIEKMGESDEGILYYTTELDLSWLKFKDQGNVRKDLIVTGDRDLFPEETEFLHDKYGAVVGDWESGAVAWVAARNKTKLIILRGVTDLVSSKGGEAYGNPELFKCETKKVMAALLELWPRYLYSI